MGMSHDRILQEQAEYRKLFRKERTQECYDNIAEHVRKLESMGLTGGDLYRLAMDIETNITLAEVVTSLDSIATTISYMQS